MKRLALVLVLATLPAFAQEPDPNVNLVKRVQIALHLHGFDPGPVNGQIDWQTQAALAQFQRANDLPASAALDNATLAALEVSREPRPEEEENASAGAGMPLAKP